jgi:Tfp pilus assembly protein PilZ
MGFPMDRRAHPRYPRRLEVRFWKQGEAQAHSGFTTNISKTGIFLGTGHTIVPGERVRLEVMGIEKGFVAEGRVVRVHRVALALRHIEQPGVGIRFLLPEELLADVLPAGQGSAPAARVATAVPAVPGPYGSGSPQPEAPVSDADAAPDGAAPPEAPPALRVVTVDFPDRSTFLSVYHRDLASGGLFVSTPNPSALQEVVLIELRTPLPGVPPLCFEARVVHRFEPQAAVGAGRNLLSGMGVQFVEPDRVKAALAPILAELRR